MRKTKDAMAETRRTIVAEAAKLFRKNGVEGIGVAEIMRAAGLTHGGFYRHFPSKEALVAAAMAQVFAERAKTLNEAEGEELRKLVRGYVDLYLSAEHVARPERGCPVAAVGSEAGRSGFEVTRSFHEGIEALLTGLSRAMGRHGPEGRAKALRVFASLVGSVVIARAAGDPRLRDELLRSVRDGDPVSDILRA